MVIRNSPRIESGTPGNSYASGVQATSDAEWIAASVSYGGFDTHGTHDRDQVVRFTKLLGIVDLAIAEAARQGHRRPARDRRRLRLRTWPVLQRDQCRLGQGPLASTSLLVQVPPGKAAAFGNRVIGSTSDDVRPNNHVSRATGSQSVSQWEHELAAGTFALDNAGVALTPAVIHPGLRKLLAVDGSDGAGVYPLPASDLAVFG